MDRKNKDDVYEKYLKKGTEFAKNTALLIEKTYKIAADEKNCIHGIGIAAAFVIKKLYFLAYFAVSFLLSETKLAFGAYPMGAAFVAATGKNMLWAYLGACAGAVFSSDFPAIDIAVYTLIVCLRRLTAIITEPDRKLIDFEDGIKLKLMSSLIGATALGAYNSIVSGFTLNSLAALAIYIAAAPSLAFLYTCIVSNQRSDATMLYHEASKGALTVSLVLSLRGVSFVSIEFSVVCAFVSTVYVTRKYGLLKGCLIGLFFGFSGASALTPIYSVAAIVSGILYLSSPYLAVTSAMLAAVSWSVYVGGYTVASSVAPSLILACGAAIAGVYGGFFDASTEKDEETISHDAVLRAEIVKNHDTDFLLESEAKAFTELSDVLYRLSNKLCKPTSYDVKEAVHQGKDALCRDCISSEACRKLNGIDVSDAWEKICTILYENGSLTEEDVPKFLIEACQRSEDICDAVNEAYALLIKNLIDSDKIEAMAIDYRAIASVLSDIIALRKTEFSIDRELSEALSARLKAEKITARQVIVYGDKRRTVFISSVKLSGLHMGEDDLRQLASEVCGCEFLSPKFELHGSDVSVTLYAAEAFSVIHSVRSLTEAESRACGDSCRCFSPTNGHFNVLISDGMGSGTEAAVTSGICVMFLEKMISAGNSVAVSLKMLNSMLRAKRSECSATIDLCNFDLVSGELEFYKSGASPTVIVRGNEIFKIESRTLPVGIIRSLDSQKTKLKAEIGDIIIMMSDGIAESDDDATWLYSLVSEIRDRKCSDIASAILSEAEKRYNKKDDATVCVIRVTPPSKKDFNV